MYIKLHTIEWSNGSLHAARRKALCEYAIYIYSECVFWWTDHGVWFLGSHISIVFPKSEKNRLVACNLDECKNSHPVRAIFSLSSYERRSHSRQLSTLKRFPEFHAYMLHCPIDLYILVNHHYTSSVVLAAKTRLSMLTLLLFTV